MSRLRIGFVGVGSMGQCAHLHNYVDRDDCEVVALAELRTDLGQRVAHRYGVPKVYPSHKELLAHEELDGIVASQPFDRHGVLLPDLYQTNLPVLTEKPLACSVEAGEKLLTALARTRARHFVGYHKRSDPATVFARQEIRRMKKTGELGELRYVRILMPAGDWIAGGFAHLLKSDEQPPSIEADPPPQDLDEDTRREFNAFVNYYIHQVNLLRHMLGEGYTVSYADPKGVLLVAHSKSGVPATIEMSPYETTVDWQEEVLVAFKRGYVKVELPAPLATNRPGRVTLFRDSGNRAVPETVHPQLPWRHAMLQQASYFVEAVKGGTTPLCEASEALEDLHVARAYLRALRGC